MSSRRFPFLRYAVIAAGFGVALMALWTASGSRTVRGNPRTAAVARSHASPALERASRMKAAETYGRLPLTFEANRGQTDSRVKYMSRGQGYTLFLTNSEAVLSMANSDRQSVVRMRLVGSNPSSAITGVDELAAKANYFIGDDPSQWHANVPTYSKVKYEQAYPGVDLVFYGNPQNLEYDFVVAPGANPNIIAMDLTTNDKKSSGSLAIAEDGDLLINRCGDTRVACPGTDQESSGIRFKKPVVYQIANGGTKMPVEGRWVLRGKNRVGFELASYDASKSVVIDPALSYSTYLGGSTGDVAQAIAVDAAGSAYVTGQVLSTNFPTVGAIQPASGGHGDAFVAKFTPDGTGLVYSTYLGGSNLDSGFGIAVDSSGNAYVGGDTGSRNFPTTAGAFQRNCGNLCQNGATDVFLTVLNPTGSALVYSTFFGGSGTDRLIEGIAVDAVGHAYITGWTTSKNLPVTTGAFQTALSGTQDGFVAEFTPDGSALVYATYLGGSVSDATSAITIDSSGDAYVTGWTSSPDFPTTTGAFQSTNGGGTSDTFVAELNPTGTALIHSTLVGGSSSEIAYGIVLNSSGNPYITGYTCSPNFPVTAGALKTTYTSGSCTTWGGNAFVAELAPDLSSLVYSTFLGGSGNDVAFNLVIDNGGIVYITGRTNSANFPVTPGAFQTKYAGSIDSFLTELAPDGSSLVYSTFFGGSASDAGYVIAMDPANNVYICGRAYSTNFPVTPGAFQTTQPGPFAAMVYKFSLGDQVWPLALNLGTQGLGLTSPPMNVTFTNSEQAALSISGTNISGANSADFAQSATTCGSTLNPGASCTVSITFTPSAYGPRTATLSLTDSAANSPQSVALAGTGSPVAITPSTLTFPTQLINTPSASQAATLTNGGQADITITSISATGPFTQTNNCGTTVTAGTSCTINVTFQPTASGPQKGTLTVVDSAGTQTAALSGMGTVMSFSPPSLNFGTQTVNTTSSPQIVTMTNVGTASVSVSAIKSAGQRASSYSATQNCIGTLAAGASCQISVTFTPKLKGVLNATINVGDTGGGSPQMIPVTGTGQ